MILELWIFSEATIAAQPTLAVDIWPGKAPGENGSSGAEKIQAQKPGEKPVKLLTKSAKVPAELHVYASGGHGFGLRANEHPCTTWLKRCQEWLHHQKILLRNPRR
jgi:hypothetical protein